MCAAPAAPVLATVVHEPAGVNCPTGGSAVRSGADADSGGVLDLEEISTIKYVCEVAALWGIVRNNPKLQYLWLEPYLLGIDVFVRGSLIITDNAALKAMSSPTRVGGDLVVARNPHLRFPALRSLRSLTVVDSPLVPTCEADALVAQTSPSQTISGTDDTATCP